MRCVVFLGCAALLGLGVYAAGMKTVTKDQYGVQISYPADWQDKGTSAWDLLNPDYSGATNTFGFGPKMDGEFFVSVIPSKPMDFKTFVSKLSSLMVSMDPSLKVSRSNEITVHGIKGYDVVYGKGSTYGRTRVVVFYKNGKRYTLSAVMFDTKPGMYPTYAPSIESVIESFRILK